jgi:TIR domain
VWWDPAIVPGQQFDDRIAEQTDKASAVAVVWTPTSVSSRWVSGEAREAADRNILVPLLTGDRTTSDYWALLRY